ncbi:NAD(P)-binding protein [Mycena capillaripes]|nr:NAD(P)-binding protein [Mycena capillaripes]
MSSYVITGAARGLGLEFVSQLSADNRNTIFAIVRNKSTATALNSLPGNNITVLEADITDTDSVVAAASAVSAATGGKLDYLINNAGVHDRSKATLDKFPTKDTLDEDLLTNFRVNTLGTIHTTNIFLPLLHAGTTKKVITISTGAADLATATGSSGQAGYSISKAALNMAMAKFAAALKQEGFVVLSISPGLVDTATERTPQENDEYQAFIQGLAKAVPGFSGPLTPQASVKMMLEVIDRWAVEETGAFVSHHGNNKWL